MLIDSTEGRLLIVAVAQTIVEYYQPSELALYPLIRDRYLADPAGYAIRDGDDDEVLGFGSHATMHTFTHAVFPITTPILAYLHSEASKTLNSDKQSLEWLNSLVTISGSSSPIFTDTQLSMICAKIEVIAQEQASRHGYQPSSAMNISNFFRERLQCPQKM